jgi:small-conductance mechanosensitive channel
MITSNLLLWSIALIIGFPLAAIVLGEWSYSLHKKERALASTARTLRNLVLPLFVFLLFLQQILKLPADSDAIKSVETLLWLGIVHASLSLLQAILFDRAEANTWRAKVPKLLVDLFRLLVVLLGGAIVLARVWGADLAGLVTALGVSSIVIGLALQDTLGSITSGIALLFERPFAVGDWLEVGGLVGQVIDINWRAVRLQTLEKEMVVIPHKLIGSEIIRNFSRPLAIHAERIQIGFSYNDPPNLAKQVLYSTARETNGILPEPEPQIFTLAYDDSAITYEVKFFLQDYEELEVIRDRFLTRVWYAARRNNLTIPFPTRTLYHFNGPTTQSQETSKKFAASLQSIPAFVPLDRPENLQNLSEEITLQHFGTGEKVLRQGCSNNALFIIVSGRATMSALDRKGREIEVLSLSAGEFFGEMTLFSSEPSTVSIEAIEDLEVMMISASVIYQTIDRQPSFARKIGKILESRRRAVRVALQSSSIDLDL